MSTASERVNMSRSAATIRVWLSRTARSANEAIPGAASCSPIHALLVSTIWPSNNSVPIARTSHLISGHDLLGRSQRVALPITPTVMNDVGGRHHRERDHQPEHGLLQADVV